MHKTYTYKIKAFKKDETVIAESEPIRQKAKKTVLVGDSTMRAVPEYYVLPWRYTLTKIGVNTSSFMHVRYSDYSIGGRAATGISKLISMNPDRVFIMMGMNELDWQSVDKTKKGYEEIIKKLKKELPEAEIVIMATSPTGSSRLRGIPANSKVNSLNKTMEKAAKRLKVSYYAWSHVFKNSKGYLKGEYGDGDGCHWTIGGARKVVSMVRKYCKENP